MNVSALIQNMLEHLSFSILAFTSNIPVSNIYMDQIEAQILICSYAFV